MRVFVSHPFKDNPIENKNKADKICKQLVEQGKVPISPLHLFSFYEDDSDRGEIMSICYRLIDIADVVFVYGDSEGCRLEEKYARSRGKPTYLLKGVVD